MVLKIISLAAALTVITLMGVFAHSIVVALIVAFLIVD
jgi:hypothetical protein